MDGCYTLHFKDQLGPKAAQVSITYRSAFQCIRYRCMLHAIPDAF